jgi:hypothetical protein
MMIVCVPPSCHVSSRDVRIVCPRPEILTVFFRSSFTCIICVPVTRQPEDIISHAKAWEDAEQRLPKTSPVKSSGSSAGFLAHLHT